MGGGRNSALYHQDKMAAREDLPDLSTDDTFMFLDLWEGFPTLWNPKDREYKSAGAKAKALETFAEHYVVVASACGKLQNKLDS